MAVFGLVAMVNIECFSVIICYYGAIKQLVLRDFVNKGHISEFIKTPILSKVHLHITWVERGGTYFRNCIMETLSKP